MNNMAAGNGQLTVPPGFRFHPTDEELLYYYLRKKVSYEPIDLDVIREVDLNKLEPWDLKEKCRIGSGPQNEWYFFSHKDKKYPTGTRTNRATAAGFWKATGRDKAIHLSDSKRIGMRKTLVFYTGRAPHGQKTDWIMHEYRLDDHDNADQIQEDGWVVCRVFMKKNHIRGFQQQIANNNNEEEALAAGYNNNNNSEMKASGSCASVVVDHPNHHYHHHHQSKHHHLQQLYDYAFHDGSMHLPQLFSPESAVPTAVPSSFVSPVSLTSMDVECSQNLLRLTSNGLVPTPDHRFSGGDWTFLDKLLANNSHSHHHHHHHHHQAHQAKCHPSTSSDHHHHPVADHHVGSASAQRLFPFQYLGCDTDILKFPK